MKKLTLLLIISIGLMIAGLAVVYQNLAEQLTDAIAMTPDGPKYISWKEHRIDDRDLSGAQLLGADGLAMGDLDGDGHMDVVAVHEDSDNVRISFGRGSDYPDQWDSFSLVSGTNEERALLVGGAEDVALGDVNGDGRLDIVVACEDVGHLIYFQAPADSADTRDMSNWTVTVLTETCNRGSWIHVDLADLNEDGQLDILGANKGGGKFSCFYLNGAATDPDAWEETILGTGEIPSNIKAVDIDDDGDLDIVAGVRGNGRHIIIFENLGGGSAWVEHPVYYPGIDGFSMEFEYLNGDDRLDIVASNNGSGNILLLTQPESLGTLWTMHLIGSINPDDGAGIKLVEINGDGRLDLFVGGYSRYDTGAYNPHGRLAWFEQPLDATDPWQRHDISRREMGMFDEFELLDVNGDNLIDLITTRGNSSYFGGVIWLEQVRTDEPVKVFTPARNDDRPEIPLPAYIVTATAGANGCISPAGDITVTHSANRTFTIIPDSGYTVAKVIVDGERVGLVTGYTFNNVMEDHSIDAIFASTDSVYVTFLVDMQNEEVSTDGVYLEGDFTDWDVNPIPMNNFYGTMWSTTILIPTQSLSEYKFINGNPNTNGVWEYFEGDCISGDIGSNRIVNVDDDDLIVGIDCFNSCNACNEVYKLVLLRSSKGVLHEGGSLEVREGGGTPWFNATEIASGIFAFQTDFEHVGFRMTYGPMIQKINNIPVMEPFTFSTELVTIKLEDDFETGVQDGQVDYTSIGWHSFGITDSVGTAQKEMLPLSYTFRMNYDGLIERITEVISSDNNTFIFKLDDLKSTNLDSQNEFQLVAYPNPLCGNTIIAFSLGQTQAISIAIYDINGRMVDVLYDGTQTEGSHKINWDASYLQNGNYIIRTSMDSGVYFTNIVKM